MDERFDRDPGAGASRSEYDRAADASIDRGARALQTQRDAALPSADIRRPGGVATPRQSGAIAIGAVAVGALAVGGLAIGALAIGRLAVGKLSMKRARVHALAIDDLEVGRLRVGELIVEPDAAARQGME